MKSWFPIAILISFVFIVGCNNAKKKSTDDISGDLIVFHAGSLSIPFKELKKEFESIYPDVNIVLEAAGSVTSARKITDLKRDCDIIASADYQVINNFLIPEYADSNYLFATNEMAIIFQKDSRYADIINESNWHEILLRKDALIGRSDPNSDPCGYRTLLMLKLAESYYNIDSLFIKFSLKDNEFIRPKASDLMALLQTHNLDYVFEYKSVAMQFGLPYIELSDSINLKSAALKEHYNSVSLEISGKKPDEKIKMVGEPMLYGIAPIINAPNPRAANAFIEFLFSSKGKEIIEKNGQDFLKRK